MLTKNSDRPYPRNPVPEEYMTHYSVTETRKNVGIWTQRKLIKIAYVVVVKAAVLLSMPHSLAACLQVQVLQNILHAAFPLMQYSFLFTYREIPTLRINLIDHLNTNRLNMIIIEQLKHPFSPVCIMLSLHWWIHRLKANFLRAKYKTDRGNLGCLKETEIAKRHLATDPGQSRLKWRAASLQAQLTKITKIF